MGIIGKSAIRLMTGELKRLVAENNKPKSRVKNKPGPKSRYQEPGFKAALKAVWKQTDYMCSKNLKKAMPVWLPAYEEVEGIFVENIRAKLLAISAASIDRVLKPYKHLGRGRCGTKPGSLLRSEIPIRTSVWDVNIPGFLEGDTVAHCGGIYQDNSFGLSLQLTSARSGPKLDLSGTKAPEPSSMPLKDMYQTLPFSIQAWDGTAIMVPSLLIAI